MLNSFLYVREEFTSELVPDQAMTYFMGIDEAGRGPILGPMVYGSAWCAHENVKELESHGFKDSKTLNSSKRENLFKILKKKSDIFGWKTVSIDSEEISNKMLLRNKFSLNEISHECAIYLIKSALQMGFRITEVFIDAVGPPEKYQQKLSNIFPNISITVANKADSTFPIVSAASICAKVIRDQLLEEYKYIEDDITDNDFGSGYLGGDGNTKTRSWLKNNIDEIFGFPKVVRFGWTPAQKIMNTNCYDVRWGSYHDEDETTNLNRTKISQRSSYFSHNCMDIVQDDF